ncbi:MAG: hypothetical protein U1F83_04130 [Verrucomicrobiota bacterium]
MAFVLAAWASLGYIGFLGGAAAGLFKETGAEMAFGLVLLLFVGLPSIIGTALGMSVRRPGGPNSVGVWIALVWNALLLCGLVLLIVVGNLMG